MLAGQPGGELVVAQRRPHAVDLVGRDLLTLTAATHHHPELGAAPDDRPSRGGAERRVVDRCLGVRPQVEDLVPGSFEVLGHLDLERVPGVVRCKGDPHDAIVAGVRAS